MTDAPTEDLIADLEALLAGEPVFVVGHPVSRAINALRALQQELERLRDALEPFELYYRLNDLHERGDQDALEVPVGDIRRAAHEFARSALTGSAQG